MQLLVLKLSLGFFVCWAFQWNLWILEMTAFLFLRTGYQIIHFWQYISALAVWYHCSLLQSRQCHWSSDRSCGEDLTHCCFPKHVERLELCYKYFDNRYTLVAYPVSMENLWACHISMCPKLLTQLYFTVDYFLSQNPLQFQAFWVVLQMTLGKV